MMTGEEIRIAREAKGMSQEDLAKAIGVTQPTIVKIESGRTTRTKYMPEIERALGGGGPADGPLFHRPPPVMLGDRDLPIYAAVEGGPGAMVVNTDPIDIVARPWYMREVRDGYGVLITGESMVPAFKPGDIAIINPKLPPQRGQDMIFVNGEEHGGFRATIKELQRWDADRWHVVQHNPPDGMDREFSLEKREWPRALRVVGKYSGG